MLMIGNGILITRDEDNPYLADGAVVCCGDKILDVGQTGLMRGKYASANFIDARGRLIMPAFINAHMHYYSVFSRGYAGKEAPAQNFDEVLAKLWWKLDRALDHEAIYYSALVCMIDCIKNGTTTVIDHHASPCAIPGSLFKIAEAAKESGVRSCLCYEVSDRDGRGATLEGVRENVDFIKYAKADDSGLLAATFGLHASVTLSQTTLAACAEGMGSLDAGYHVHVAEGPADEKDSWEKYGKSVTARFREFGITGPRSIAVHCIHIDDEEKEILKETGTAVVHNPESNMGNAVGVCPVLDLCGRGVLLGLGSDGFVSDMLQSYKMANALQKHHNGHPSAAWGEIPEMLFSNNALIANRYFDAPLGKIAPCCAADIIVSDYLPPTELDADNINAHLLFGASGRSVVTTVAAGKVLMSERQLTGIDENEVFVKARECARRVWQKI